MASGDAEEGSGWKKKKKTQPNQAKRAATPEEDVESENAQVSSNDADSETS